MVSPNFITIMVINMAAALFMLALFIFRGLYAEDAKKWVPAFALSGFVALVTGLYFCFMWPYPGAYNIAYGEPSVLMGVLLLGAAWAISKSWSFTPLSVYALFAGIVPIVIGVQFINLQISQTPLEIGSAMITSGLAGILALPATFFYSRNPGLSRIIQWAAIILLVVAAGILAISGYGSYMGHIADYAA